MMNQTILIGRIVKDVEKEGNLAKIVLAVLRSFKNEEGVYETDFIPVKLFQPIADNALEYCKRGDLVGIKGRIQSDNGIEIIAEKMTFLATNRKPDDVLNTKNGE